MLFFASLDTRHNCGEERWTDIGVLCDVIVVAVVFTERDSDTIRVISMRKAKKHEREKYEKAIKDRLGAG